MENTLLKKGLILGIIMLFFVAIVIPNIAGYDIEIDKKEINNFNNRIKQVIDNNECDLRIKAAYTPDQPKQNYMIYFHISVYDDSGNYSATSVEIHIESDMTLINGDQLSFEWKDGYAMGDYRFIWPDSGVSHYVKLTAVPIEGFNDTDESDNSIIFEDLIGKDKSISVSSSSASVSGQTLNSDLISCQSTTINSATYYTIKKSIKSI